MIKSLLLSLALMAGSPLEEGIKLSQDKNYEASEVTLAKVPSSNRNYRYRFYKMVNAYGLNDKKGAMKWADSFEFAFEPIPNRYKDLAMLMKDDMETWKDKEKDDLGDISRDMKKIGDRLENNIGGPETQQMQKEVADRLKAMIDKAEDDMKKAQEAAKAEADAKMEALKQKEFTIPNDTHNQQDYGTGKVNQKKVREVAEMWGKLPDKERAQALRELIRCMPARDRSVIEAYFRNLAARSNSR